MELHHKCVGAHFGVAKVLAQVRKRFYWPRYKADVERWCRHCKICQQRKPGPGKGLAKLAQCPVGTPLERIAVDIMGPLPTTDVGREVSLPIDLVFGSPPLKQPVPKHPKCPTEYVEWVRQASEQAFEFARENLKESDVHQEQLYNRRVDIRSNQPGDWVWRWYPPSAKVKLGKGWTGPYLVLQRISDVTYKIQQHRLSDAKVVHAGHLKRYVADEYPGSWLGYQ